MSDDMPKFVNVTKTITYNVEGLIKEIQEDRESSVWVNSKGESGGQPETLEVTFDEVIERIQELAEDDFSCGWGHKGDIDDLIFTDQDGNEI